MSGEYAQEPLDDEAYVDTDDLFVYSETVARHRAESVTPVAPETEFSEDTCATLPETAETKSESSHHPMIEDITTDQDTPLPPTTPTRYQAERQISKGGMKRIIRVRDTATKRDVAMAVLAPESVHKDDARRRFLHEARITANLEHPNIVPIHDIGVNDDRIPFFTMKLLGGETLADILNKLRKDEENYREQYHLSALLMIYLKILDAIAFAHARGIIHLDIKPDNIQIGHFGEVAVLDWGLARAVNHPPPEEISRSTVLLELPTPTCHTLDGEIKGTVGFMAPEQAAGRNDEKDERTDIYALGAILYAMLSWRRSVRTGGNDTAHFNAALRRIEMGELLPLTNPHCPIPSALSAVTLKAMSLKPEDRYQSVEALRADIMRYIDGFPTSAEHAGIVRQCWLWLCRHRSLAIILMILAAGGIAALGYLHIQNERMVARWGHARTLVPLESGIVRSHWQVVEGEWDYTGGQWIRSTGAATRPARIRYTQPLHGNIAVEFDAMAETRESLLDGGDLSVVLNWNPAENEDGYFFQIGGISNSVASIQRRNGFQAMIPFSIESGRTYRIRVEKEEGRLRLICDGKCLIDVEDMFYLEGGYFGLYAFGGGKRFWNIRVYERGVPELVSPLTEGDGYFRRSRGCADSTVRHYLLTSARDAYTRIFNEYRHSTLGRDALFRRAHVNLALEDIPMASDDIIRLDRPENQSYELTILRAELAVRERNFLAAHDIYSRALTNYPDRKHDIVGLLRSHLSDSERFAGEEHAQARQSFWRMVVSNQSTQTFRAHTKHFDILDFPTQNLLILDINGSSVRDLTPLQGMQIQHLNIAGTPVNSLLPLRSMQMKYLDCSHTPIGTVEPLRGMPLQTLILHGCRRLRDIRAIGSLTSLERLSLPRHLRREQVLALRERLPNLKYIQFDNADWSITPEIFFAELLQPHQETALVGDTEDN